MTLRTTVIGGRRYADDFTVIWRAVPQGGKLVRTPIHADMHVAKVDVPAFLAGFAKSAAGEFGHAHSKRHPSG